MGLGTPRRQRSRVGAAVSLADGVGRAGAWLPRNGRETAEARQRQRQSDAAPGSGNPCEFFIPEVLIAARASRAATDLLRPLLVGDEAVQAAGVVVCGTVKGDLHDIGKTIEAAVIYDQNTRPVHS